MKHLAIIVGTRPEAIKLLPIYLELRTHERVKTTLILTGQHRELALDVFRTFDCTPDITLDVMQSNQTLAELTSRLLISLEGSMPADTNIVIVQGDTTSAFVGSLLAFYRGIPCGHVEAGLRSADIMAPFPEEFNRRAVSISAKWHFAPTKSAAKNLAAEGIHRDVYIVGNTSIDAALMIAGKNQSPSGMVREVVPEYWDERRKIILVTAHRRENFGVGLQSIIAAVHRIATERPEFLFVWPVHPNPNVHGVVIQKLAGLANVRLLEPLAYNDLLYVMRRAFVALSDSGGIQEEAPSFGCPVLVLRDKTERPEAIAVGCNCLVGTDTDRIIGKFNEIADNPHIYRRMIEPKNPYGDGKTSRRIVDVLLSDKEMI